MTKTIIIVEKGGDIIQFQATTTWDSSVYDLS